MLKRLYGFCVVVPAMILAPQSGFMTVDGAHRITVSAGSATYCAVGEESYFRMIIYESDKPRDEGRTLVVIVRRTENDSDSEIIEGMFHILGPAGCEIRGPIAAKADSLRIIDERTVDVVFETEGDSCRTSDESSHEVTIQLSGVPLSENPKLVGELAGAISGGGDNYPYIRWWLRDLQRN